jgi:hypothetical protein
MEKAESMLMSPMESELSELVAFIDNIGYIE